MRISDWSSDVCSSDLADREDDLDHLVERRLVAGGAERAGVLLALHRLQRGVGIEHPAAARAEHVPRQLEEAEPGGMQEGGNGLLFVEPLPGGKGDRKSTRLNSSH